MKKKKIPNASEMGKLSGEVRAELMKDPEYRAKISEQNCRIAKEAWKKRKKKLSTLQNTQRSV